MAQWKLSGASPAVTLDISVGDFGPMSGTLAVGGTTFAVSGSWAASGSVTGRNASAFGIAGQSAAAAPAFVSAAGIMTGPGASPVQVSIQLSVSSSADGSLTRTTAVLLPAR